MQFNSYIFIMAFLPLMFIGYFGANRINSKVGEIFLIIASAVFYIYAGWQMAAILGVSIVLNYAVITVMKKWNKASKAMLIIGLCVNVAALLYFKYFNFFINTSNSFLGTHIETKEILLPLAISFYTFSQIAYLVNVYKGIGGGYNCRYRCSGLPVLHTVFPKDYQWTDCRAESTY